ncbi:hypothetical protein PoB_001360100 [Plakobranchus ocellatus]|uniref:Uncharacterized protein n=1 Tax=Plakobranchus ocellatus TaxID=259542 RepID=A0AAV3YIK5_9GAST|nr:hypothetical protein PoB_001360100 [Plakobranchus ocellatus]
MGEQDAGAQSQSERAVCLRSGTGTQSTQELSEWLRRLAGISEAVEGGSHVGCQHEGRTCWHPRLRSNCLSHESESSQVLCGDR